jgi:hypothetical protein
MLFAVILILGFAWLGLLIFWPDLVRWWKSEKAAATPEPSTTNSFAFAYDLERLRKTMKTLRQIIEEKEKEAADLHKCPYCSSMFRNILAWDHHIEYVHNSREV